MLVQELNTVEDIEKIPFIKIDYVGETEKEGNWQCDQWRVTLSNKSGSRSIDYFTGLGLRERKYIHNGRKWDSMRKKFYEEKVKKPKIARILNSLILDSEAESYNFNDWCENYGYSNDSLKALIKALNVYKQCLDTATTLRKYFSPDVLKRIKELLIDY